MKKINIVYICFLIIVIILLSATFFIYLVIPALTLNTEETSIEKIDENLKQLLQDRYMLYITDDIIFISGYFDNAFQDNSIYLTFKIPNDALNNFYDGKYYKEASGITYDSEKNIIIKRLEFEKELYTQINFYNYDGEYTLIKFIGRYPYKRQLP